MKRILIPTLGIITSAMFAFAAGPVAAQTTANGPYYATPSWDQKLQCDTTATCPRFVVLANWNSEAVLDRETGLVWEKSPELTLRDWQTALGVCNQKALGGRRGWRLPSVQELAALTDPTTFTAALPAGHPFVGVQSSVAQLPFYWSATTSASSTLSAWIVSFFNGLPQRTLKSGSLNVWCVRGGQGFDAQ